MTIAWHIASPPFSVGREAEAARMFTGIADWSCCRTGGRAVRRIDSNSSPCSAMHRWPASQPASLAACKLAQRTDRCCRPVRSPNRPGASDEKRLYCSRLRHNSTAQPPQSTSSSTHSSRRFGRDFQASASIDSSELPSRPLCRRPQIKARSRDEMRTLIAVS